jgi:hypothetical protein
MLDELQMRPLFTYVKSVLFYTSSKPYKIRRYSFGFGVNAEQKQFAVQEGAMSATLSKDLERTSQIVFRAEEYAKLFSAHSGSSTERVFRSLHENLTHLYAEILNFLIRATKFFEKPTWSAVICALDA